MKLTCTKINEKTGKSCHRRVPDNVKRCWQHPIMGEFIIIDDVDENGKPIVHSDEVFNTVINPAGAVIHKHSSEQYDGPLLPDKIEYLKEALEDTVSPKIEKNSRWDMLKRRWTCFRRRKHDFTYFTTCDECGKKKKVEKK